MLTDYHTHLRPDDVSASAAAFFTEENVHRYLEVADRRGIADLGFSEHVYRFREALDVWRHPFWESYAVDELDAYCDFVQQMKAAGHAVKLGLEVDYIAGREEQIAALIDGRPWDYVIGSVHFISHGAVDHDGYDAWAEAGADAVWGEYFRALGDAAASGLFDIIGHGLHFTIVGAPGVSGDCAHTSTRQDYEAAGGGRTTDPRDAVECVGLLGDTQPGITIGKDPNAPGPWSLTGDLGPYDPRVCPQGSHYDGNPNNYFCDPAAQPHVDAQGLNAASAPAPAPSGDEGTGTDADGDEPPQKKIDEALGKLKKGELPTEEDLREILGLPPGAALPPEIGAALGSVGLGGGGEATQDRAVAEDLLDFLFGP